MRNILIIGVGRSSSSLVRYLIEKAPKENLNITLADLSLENARKSTLGSQYAEAIELDINEKGQRQNAIQKADIVISMLPAFMHIEVAKDCVEYGKHMVTASYISAEMQELDSKVTEKGLVFMNEIGLDPGIDHMSAMKVIDGIKDQGGEVILFESFTGGLMAPECDDNLWKYKFTWNPRNVVLAGQGGVAKFLQEGRYKYIPYQKLFRRTEILDLDKYGKFEAYANRDSLKYKSIYGLDDVLTLYRGTIRHIGYSRAWNCFIQLGMTDDSYSMEGSEKMTYREFTNSFLSYNPGDSVELKLRSYLKIDQDDTLWGKLLELDIFSSEKIIGIKNASPAEALQEILTQKWSLKETDKDMIVMHHIFGYELDGERKQLESSLRVIGDDQKYTSMAKTVGLPVAIAALKILNKEITKPGVQLPITKEVYTPILKELEQYGVVFTEKETKYQGYNDGRMI
ncbi:MAG: saccharopine dehydrogenase NADP-binding domain-containing protein [Flavobacteriaceae bacterium]|nr:saccharopine dehydrogenase NADP-binding domain-containing protein [Flavobacteriaceae bacterium]